jgi:hypothetical protein
MTALKALPGALNPGSATDRLDEIAVFALVVVALFYIAALSCWFIM